MAVHYYFCKKCSEVKEDVIVPFSQLDSIVVECSCGNEMTRQVGNAGGFRLKGGGWGEDGYSEYMGDINITRKRDGKAPLDYNSIHGTNF
jgi:predicted nucleic acid-binding Zn ribbon protein